MHVSSEKFGSISLKLAQNYRTVSVSYHEAGHAICGLLHFMFIGEVKVDELKRGVSGNTDYDTAYDDEQYDQIDAAIKGFLLTSEICMKYAGLAAEKIYFKDLSGSDAFPIVLKFGNEPDTREASEIIAKNNLVIPGPKRYLYKKKLIRKITSVLKEYWDDVKLIAHSLYEKRKLQYDDLKLLLTRKSLNKKFWKKQFKDIDFLFKDIGDNELDKTEVARILLR